MAVRKGEAASFKGGIGGFWYRGGGGKLLDIELLDAGLGSGAKLKVSGEPDCPTTGGKQQIGFTI